MSDSSLTPETPETPDVAETAGFLRRFAELMSNGYNATYLHRAADLLENMTARMTAASDEENLWRYKYETVTRHADALEAECETLKLDIEGHIEIAASILNERDALKAALQASDAELAELDAAWSNEHGEHATRAQVREDVMAELRVAFDREREALEATSKAQSEQLEQLRVASQREREQLDAAVEGREQSLAELRLARDREIAELQARLKVSADELEALRVVSRRERDELQAKVASLEVKRAALRTAFDRISDLRNQVEHPDGVGVSGKPGLEADATPVPAPRREGSLTISEAKAVVPKATLRQVRVQFEYLARECNLRGDIASQVMCELGAYTLDLALTSGEDAASLSVGEVALSILAPVGPLAPATADLTDSI